MVEWSTRVAVLAAALMSPRTQPGIVQGRFRCAGRPGDHTAANATPIVAPMGDSRRAQTMSRNRHHWISRASMRSRWAARYERFDDQTLTRLPQCAAHHHNAAERSYDADPRSTPLDAPSPLREWAGTDLVFELSPAEQGTQIRFTHRGLTPGPECYDQCSNAWSFLIKTSLRRFITTGDGPNPPPWG